jgi:hypothetical protein
VSKPPTRMAVHDSKASWEQFRDGTLRPAFEKGIIELYLTT